MFICIRYFVLLTEFNVFPLFLSVLFMGCHSGTMVSTWFFFFLLSVLTATLWPATVRVPVVSQHTERGHLLELPQSGQTSSGSRIWIPGFHQQRLELKNTKTTEKSGQFWPAESGIGKTRMRVLSLINSVLLNFLCLDIGKASNRVCTQQIRPGNVCVQRKITCIQVAPGEGYSGCWDPRAIKRIHFSFHSRPEYSFAYFACCQEFCIKFNSFDLLISFKRPIFFNHKLVWIGKMTEAFICDLMYILHYFQTHCTRHNTETTPLHVGNDL